MQDANWRSSNWTTGKVFQKMQGRAKSLAEQRTEKKGKKDDEWDEEKIQKNGLSNTLEDQMQL